MKCDRCRMDVSRVYPARSIFSLVDSDLLVCRIRQYDLQQGRMRYHAAPFLAGSWFRLKHAQGTYHRDADRTEVGCLSHFVPQEE